MRSVTSHSVRRSTRCSENSAFIGWPLDGVARGGHIEGAVDFSGVWLTIEGADAKEQEAIDQQPSPLFTSAPHS